jgi:hypothetical protein
MLEIPTRPHSNLRYKCPNTAYGMDFRRPALYERRAQPAIDPARFVRRMERRNLKIYAARGRSLAGCWKIPAPARAHGGPFPLES